MAFGDGISEFFRQWGKNTRHRQNQRTKRVEARQAADVQQTASNAITRQMRTAAGSDVGSIIKEVGPEALTLAGQAVALAVGGPAGAPIAGALGAAGASLAATPATPAAVEVPAAATAPAVTVPADTSISSYPSWAPWALGGVVVLAWLRGKRS